MSKATNEHHNDEKAVHNDCDGNQRNTFCNECLDLCYKCCIIKAPQQTTTTTINIYSTTKCFHFEVKLAPLTDKLSFVVDALFFHL